MASELPLPFETFVSSILRDLQAADLAVFAAVSRLAGSCVAERVAGALEPLLGLTSKPRGVGWAELLRRVTEWPRLLVLGGEDATDEPQLHLAVVSLRQASRTADALSTSEPQARPPTAARRHSCLLPAGRYRPGVARLGFRVYILGGTGPEGDVSADVLCFDAVTFAWDPRPVNPMPNRRHGHEVVCALGRYLLCIGGRAVSHPHASDSGNDDVVGGSTDVLDTVTGCWAALPCALTAPRVYFGAVTLGRYVLVSGGLTHSGRRLRCTEVLDATDLPRLFSADDESGRALDLCWRLGPPLLFPRYDFSLAGPVGARLYAVGGSGARRLVEVLDVSWAFVSELRAAPELRATASVLQGSPQVHEALLFAGWIDLHLHMPSAVDVAMDSVSPLSQPAPVCSSAESCLPFPSWELHPVELPEGRSCGNTVAAGGRLCLVGGSGRSVLFFEPGAGSWEPIGVELDTMRLGAKAVALGFGSG